MTLKEGQYSNNFWAIEFDYVEPEEDLLDILERLREITGDSIIINSGPRDPERHIEVYKRLETLGKLNGKKWHESIPWGSRHLPAFGKKLRAVDFKAVKSRDELKTAYYSGDELLNFLEMIQEEKALPLGIGVGDFYCHLDVDRKKPTVWRYS